MQRPTIVPALDVFFGGFCLAHGNFRRKARVGIQLWSELFGTIEIGFGQVHGRKGFGLYAFGKFAGGKKEKFVGDRHR